MVNGMVFFNMGLVTVWLVISTTASIARSSVFDSKNGVCPGTIAIFSNNGPIGTIMAYWLSKVPWLSNLRGPCMDIAAPVHELLVSGSEAAL